MPVRARFKAKAKAKAKRAAKSERQTRRRDAVRTLNTLVDEVQLAVPHLPRRTASSADVEARVRLLELRCSTTALSDRLRSAVKQWSENGGNLSHALVPQPAATPADVALVLQHKVLQPGFVP